MEIELIEPIGDSAFKTWLEQHGPGIHHIAAVTNTPYVNNADIWRFFDFR